MRISERTQPSHHAGQRLADLYSAIALSNSAFLGAYTPGAAAHQESGFDQQIHTSTLPVHMGSPLLPPLQI